MRRVKSLVLTGYGLNCDHETAHAFALAGADADRVHINSLIDGSASIDAYQVLAFVGGFSWGDDHGAGVIQAVRMRTHLGEGLVEFVEKGGLILGICNGFQTLVNMGLLPGLDDDYRRRCVSLLGNDSGNFRNDWVTLKVNPESPCVFTKGLDLLEFPVRHGEGKFFTDPDTLNRIFESRQAVLRYALADGSPAGGRFPENPNGSLEDIAGICDPTGRIFGLMPHPEAYNHPANHPQWTWEKEIARRRGLSFVPPRELGTRLFQNAVDFFK